MSDTQSVDSQPRPRGRPWVKGQSGNPAGRRPGCRNKATRAAEMYLDGEAEALIRLAVTQAFAGDPAALKLCLARTVAPRRERHSAQTLFVADVGERRVDRRDARGRSREKRQIASQAIRAVGAAEPAAITLGANVGAQGLRVPGEADQPRA